MNVRVRRIRSNDPKGFGGCIFTGTEMDCNGDIINPKEYTVIKAPYYRLNDTHVELGQWWQVNGPVQRTTVVRNGYQVTELEMVPIAMQLLRPSGKHLEAFLTENAAFTGIGERKAERLWNRFGEQLFAILNKADIETLSTVVNLPMAEKLIEAWNKVGDSQTIQWLQHNGFSVKLGQKLISRFKNEVQEKIEEDPYRLLSFCASWKKVDKLAQMTFGLPKDDIRRLLGAVEESCYRLFDNGNTCASIVSVVERLKRLLGNEGPVSLPIVNSALKAGKSNGSYIIRKPNTIHPVGPFIMEKVVAIKFNRALTNQRKLLTNNEVNKILDDHDSEEKYTLNAEQRSAIHMANQQGLSVITGGAGVGKTAVLKALLKIYDKANHNAYQVAVTGRAAKRMQEATSRSSRTIDGFVKNISDNEMGIPSVVIIDEASMVDIIRMYRLVRKFSNYTRVVLVGDPYQLPPVGPGLVLHELCGSMKSSLFPQQLVPTVELTQVHRHGNFIAEFAKSIRHGKWPKNISRNPDFPISFIRCDKREINDIICNLYQQNPENTQILACTKNSPYGGNKFLNNLCQSRFSPKKDEILLWNEDFQMYQRTGLRIGDPVICTRNLWEKDLQNGSLGRIKTVNSDITSTSKKDYNRPILGQIHWDDDVIRDVPDSILEDLELSYSITIHKSQGSQFPRVIIPMRSSRILDRTLIYTAITRAQKQVILVGDEIASRKAVEAPPSATNRSVSLGNFLKELMDS